MNRTNMMNFNERRKKITSSLNRTSSALIG